MKVSRTGNKMEAASDRDGDPAARMRDSSLAMTTDARGIAAMLTDITGRLVVDETGLAGCFNVNFEWVPGASDDAVLRSVEEQLGLHLESQTGPVPVFVVKDIQRPNGN